jgi:hypothetical protein
MYANPQEAELQGTEAAEKLKSFFAGDPKATMAATLDFLHPHDSVFELCIIGPKNPRSSAWEGYARGKKPIVAGWFRDHDKAVALAAQVQAAGIYITLNPCEEALLARANERLVAGVGRTKDSETQCIRNFLIDIDPDRPEGISSTEIEHGAALDMAQEVQMDLSTAGWPDPLASDSGNGAGLIYAIDLPNTPETTALLKTVLVALATKYAETLASLRLRIDTSVHNPARLTRLLGTMNCKGDSTPDRPHRLSRIISRPEARVAVSRELLETIAQAAGNHEAPRDTGYGGADGFDLAAYLAHYGVTVMKVKPHHGGVLHCLQECIFDSSHSGNEAAIGQAADGLLFYQCFHDSCKGRTWAEARQLISGEDNLWQFTNLRDRKAAPGSIQGGERREPGIDKASWPVMAPEAFHGLAGEFVRLVEPHTESDPVALLLQFLAGFGNQIGRGAYAKVEADTHCCNLFEVAVGETAKGRKGTSWGQVKAPLITVDPDWRGRVKSGLSSGEGLIFQVRDAILKKVARKKNGQTFYEEECIDPGEDDKRLMVVESEFANVLRQIERHGNILSAVSRDAWDTGDLGTLIKNSPTKATGAHVSVIGHITKGELKRYLTRTEAGNGFGNRILWFCVKRSKVLPEGGRIHEVDFAPFLKRLGEARVFAQCAGEVTRDPEARSLWAKVYPDLSEGKPGMVGALTSRAEAQVLRLSMIYALLDLDKLVRVQHLLAALAVWDYCETSVKYIFGQSLGDPVADGILEALEAAQDGLTRTEIYNLFGRHQRSENIQQAIGELLRRGFIAIEAIETRGRPTEKLKYTGAHKAHKAH